ncbi:hypothetical protein IE81DRAFT_344995 [Ceraceosorus guamensis]|uniref:Uncharacterized protein n=1 Tax=Ceraceosorus guamensis TaxID=1522189 RepID=A0A316W608_9BASI|nr:hypothetical protein IE81DRAFT_344995 [Ceraceosorus guamensis]PWN45309.1 hypothetical protein IE81DRAFT_344995 [Ceraceosorus guamensis]
MPIAAEVSLDEVRRHVDAIFELAQEQDDRQRMIFAPRGSPSPSPTPAPTLSCCEVSRTPDASEAKEFGNANGPLVGCHPAPGASACNAKTENGSQTQRQTPAGMRGYVDTRKLRAFLRRNELRAEYIGVRYSAAEVGSVDARRVNRAYMRRCIHRLAAQLAEDHSGAADARKEKAATGDEIAVEEVDLLDPQEIWHKRCGNVSLTCWHYGEDGPVAQLTHVERASFAMFEMEVMANGWSLRLSGPAMEHCRLTIQRPDGREEYLEQDAVEG